MRGLPRKGLVAALFIAAVLTQVLPAAAQNLGDPVARVIKIKGDRLDYSRGGADKWYQAYVEMKDYKDDRLKTNASSYGSIEFYTGGQIGINKDTTIEITSEDTANVINLKKGGLWGKLATQPDDKPVEIRTSSGVMGIRGTEFVINDSEDGTEVAVLEGEVAVTPTGGQEILLTEGQKVYLEKLKDVETVNQSPEVVDSSPEALRNDLLSSQEWSDFNEALGWARTINAYIPGRGFSNGLYWANRGVNVINNPEQAAKNYAASQVNSRVGFGIGSKIANSSSKKKPDFPSNLSPDSQAEGGSAVSSSNLAFSWDELEKAKKYFVMVGRDEKMDELVWTHETGKKETSVSYPADAEPLAAGRYYWRVIPLDDDGEPVKKAKAAQTWVDIK